MEKIDKNGGSAITIGSKDLEILQEIHSELKNAASEVM